MLESLLELALLLVLEGDGRRPGMVARRRRNFLTYTYACSCCHPYKYAPRKRPGGLKYGGAYGIVCPASSGHRAYSGWPFKRQPHPYSRAIFCLRAFIFGGIFGGIFLFPGLLSPPFLFSFPPPFMELVVNPPDAPRVAEEEEELDVDSSNDDSEGGDAARREGGSGKKKRCRCRS